ncbi:helix-turn-helix transcriptional regulator [Salinivibrio sp. YCSC6]|uniref:helix-turn-helix domain-containing protein n=1 Tax=Salinivibrio sp. YCSC6 TaxID=2003370 RepID=UPI000BBC3817|nr:helix-turn-helix transcriptional regulator [Salinivibrio sp. YCSC6]PCE67576.1 hypothetical protein B6G00_04310 [Salinivibrio sp. YCSC6]QCF35520.1 helix-turn-helix transcriptional regulator [Salinivibrio sp. YCSC6]
MSARDMFFPKGTQFSDAEERAFAREDLVYQVTETLLMAMEDKGVSKVELARRLNKSKSHVTRLLDGSRNMTLASLSDICFAIGITPEVKIPVNLPEKRSESGWSRASFKQDAKTKKASYKSESNIVIVPSATWKRVA